jgi:hypothetical protein
MVYWRNDSSMQSGLVSLGVITVLQQLLFYGNSSDQEGVKPCILACIYKKGPQVPSGSITLLVSFNFMFGCLGREVLFKDRRLFQNIRDSSVEMPWFQGCSSWNVLFRCEITGKILKGVFLVFQLLMVSLLVKCRNLHISSSLFHVIIFPNPSVEITFLW